MFVSVMFTTEGMIVHGFLTTGTWVTDMSVQVSEFKFRGYYEKHEGF